LPFIIEPQPGEEIYLQKEFRGSHQHVFAMGVSNQALYLSAQAFALKRDAWYFKRVPLSDVSNVRLVKQKPVYILLLSVVLFLFGMVLSVLMMWNALNPEPGIRPRVSGWPFALAVAGIVIPFIARGRRILIVRMRKGKFKWKPQLAVDKKTRELCAKIQDEILEACKSVGIHVEATNS
jgi:hypothetical protein